VVEWSTCEPRLYVASRLGYVVLYFTYAKNKALGAISCEDLAGADELLNRAREFSQSLGPPCIVGWTVHHDTRLVVREFMPGGEHFRFATPAPAGFDPDFFTAEREYQNVPALEELPAECHDPEWAFGAMLDSEFDRTNRPVSSSPEISFGDYRLQVYADSRVLLSRGDQPAPVIELDTLRGRPDRRVQSAVPWLEVAAPVPLVVPAPVVPAPAPTQIEIRAADLAQLNGAGWDDALDDRASAGLKPGVIAVARELLNAQLHGAKLPSDLAMQGSIGIYRETIKEHRQRLLNMGAGVFPASAPFLERYQQQTRSLTTQIIAAGASLGQWFAFLDRLHEVAPRIAGESWITIAVGQEFGAWSVCGKQGQPPTQEEVARISGFDQSRVSGRVAALVEAKMFDDPYA
jgi:hypothetical protein